MDGRQPLGVEIHPQLRVSKKTGPHSFNHREINSAIYECRRRFHASEEATVPTEAFIAALGDPKQRTQLDFPQPPDLGELR